MKRRQIIGMSLLGLLCASNFAVAQPEQRCELKESFFMVPDAEANSRSPQTEDTGIFAYSLNKTEGGEQVGTCVVRRTYLSHEHLARGPESVYESAATLFLKGGNLITFGMVDYDPHAPNSKWERAIVGGTGIYSGVSGSLFYEHVGKHRYKIISKATVPCR
jgi:hypothetical protein